MSAEIRTRKMLKGVKVVSKRALKYYLSLSDFTDFKN